MLALRVSKIVHCVTPNIFPARINLHIYKSVTDKMKRREKYRMKERLINIAETTNSREYQKRVKRT